jgi:hypothetical protein
MKREFENEHPEIFGPMHCEVCGIEATEENKGCRPTSDVWLCNAHRHVADQPEFREGLEGGTVRLFYAGDDAELDSALDAFFTRTPSHSFDGDDPR